MIVINLVLYILMFLIAVVLYFYNWAYINQVLKAKRELRIKFPGFIHKTLKTNIFLSIALSVLILFVLLTKIGL